MTHTHESSRIRIQSPEHSFRPALDSGLSVGDQLLQVDGQSLISVTHLNAIRFLKGIPFTQKTINFKLKFSKFSF